MTLIEFFVGRMDDERYENGILNMALILIFVDVLLVHSGPQVHLGMIHGAYEGFNPVPVIFGETFHWLDAAHVISGSPLLLFMWFLERFRLIANPRTNVRLAEIFFRREVMRSFCGSFNQAYLA